MYTYHYYNSIWSPIACGLIRVLQSGTNNFAKRKAMALTWSVSLESQCIVNSHPGSRHRSLLTEESRVTILLLNVQNEVSLNAPVREKRD